MEDGSASLEKSDNLKFWEKLAEEQSVLFRKIVADNEELHKRVDELERELSVWKIGFKATEDEKSSLQKNIARLERSMGSLKDDNPLLLCLIDGDGNIFSQDLITSGQVGGRQAAMLLTKGFTDYMATESIGSSGRGQVWLTVYCNKNGLQETLVNNKICSAEEFEAFVIGFNQASPLFSIVDVGGGKEAADAKIKECLRVFTRFPQMSRVFFGGSHDNGYTSTLNYLENEGLLKKIVLLRGYRSLALELRNLNLPELEIEGVFMSKKLPTTIFKKTTVTTTSGLSPEDFEKFRLPFKSPRISERSLSPIKHISPLKYLDPALPLHKQTPRPCTFHYLSICKHGDKCTYGHDYYLSPENLTELRSNAKKSPCFTMNKNHVCQFGDACPSGHICPKGPKCSHKKQGKCKFTGRGMHSITFGADMTRTHSRSGSNANGSVQTDDSPSSSTPMSPVASSTYDSLLGVEHVEFHSKLKPNSPEFVPRMRDRTYEYSSD